MQRIDKKARTTSYGLPKLGLVTLTLPRVLDAARLVTAVAESRDTFDLVALGAAAIALTLEPTSSAWRPPSTLRAAGNDPVVWGEAIFDGLVEGKVLADDYAGSARIVSEVGAEIVEWVSERFAGDAAQAEAVLVPFVETPGGGEKP